jgi:4-hydroxyproline epimerase
LAHDRVQVVDSHTGGEPTRVVLAGGPDLGSVSLRDRMLRFAHEHAPFRRAMVTEPRASEAVVGALLCAPTRPDSTAAVIFFNNSGCLGMCGHGTIGLVTTLAYLGKIGPGLHRIETPVGIVTANLHPDGRVTFENVPSYRAAIGIAVEVPGFGSVTGDIAWGGNWFFLTEDRPCPIDRKHLGDLMHFTSAIRDALETSGIRGKDGAEVDHIELNGPASSPALNGRNFVLCPGREYDRSPCGTGTSAKLACLYADGKLAAGQTWRQESVTGSVFEGSIVERDGQLIPSITGSAFVTSESTLILDHADPFCWGIEVPAPQ